MNDVRSGPSRCPLSGPAATLLLVALTSTMVLTPPLASASLPSGSRTALYLDRTITVPPPPATLPDDGFWVSPEELTRINDFVLKPEGACLDELCIPVDRGGREAIVRVAEDREWFDLLAFADKVGQPRVSDPSGTTVSFGPIPAARTSFLHSALAPDFALPDREGRLHRLSDHRGKKVLILTWASW